MKIKNLNFEWLGHATFRIRNSLTIYTDPFSLDETPKQADIIFVSHSHYDHCSPEKIREIRGENTIIVASKDCEEELQGKIKSLTPRESLEVQGVEIKAAPAYNIGKDFHPKENKWLGFIFNLDGNRIYFAGDTDVIPEMEGLNVDIALLPVGGTYTMNQSEAVEAVKKINPEIVIPMHFGTIRGTRADPEEFKEQVERETDSRVEIL